MELDLIERVATPTYLDVCLSGEYLFICDSLYENAQPRAKLLISVEAKMFSIVIQA